MEEEVELTVVVPVYDEEQRIGAGLAAILGYLASRGGRTELLVVDDGSTDRTRAEAERILAGSDVESRVLSNGRNRGKGYSVRHGMLEARGARALFTDIDLSTPMDDLERLEAALDDGADIAIGSRDAAGSELLREQPWYRELAGAAFNVAVRLLAVSGIRDTQCGFKLFRRAVAREVFGRQTIERWGFDVEILYVARRLGYRIAEVPVRWTNDERSRVNVLRDGLVMLGDIFRVRWRHRGL